MERITLRPGQRYTFKDVKSVAEGALVEVSRETRQLVRKSYEEVLKIEGDVYGMTVGVGDLKGQRRNKKDSDAPKNMLLSHAAGAGRFMNRESVRAMIFSRLIALSQGQSGVRPELLVFMGDLLNKDVVPRVHSGGSIGTGDLQQLSEAFVSIYNKGKVEYNGEIMEPHDAFGKAGVRNPGELVGRESLALMSGNNAAIGIGSLVLSELESYAKKSILSAALSMEGRGGTHAAFFSENQNARPHPGQVAVARSLENLLEDSTQIIRYYTNEQDPISFKAVSARIGVGWNFLQNAEDLLVREINAGTDNPFFVNGAPVEASNYDSSELAHMLDRVGPAVAMITNASAARINILTNDILNNGLPKHLSPGDAGGRSGFMILPNTANYFANEIMARSASRSLFSATVANGQEDVSSNAYSASLNARDIMEFANDGLGLEYLASSQAIALRLEINPSLRLGLGTAPMYEMIKATLTELDADYRLPFKQDVYQAGAIEAINDLHKQPEFLSKVDLLLGVSC